MESRMFPTLGNTTVLHSKVKEVRFTRDSRLQAFQQVSFLTLNAKERRTKSAE